MARKSMLYIDFSNFEEYAERLEQLGANVQEVFSKAMEEAAAEVQQDTHAAMADANLPAGGMFSNGDTVGAIIDDVHVSWSGSVGEVPLGFDKTVAGAGGFLITGTPKMRPDAALEEIYGRKTYEKKINKKIEAALQKEINSRLGG